MNELLTLLTNRIQGFAWIEMNQTGFRKPVDDGRAMKFVRRFFSLATTDTDYFAVSALCCVSSVPDFLTVFNPQTSYDLRFYKTPADSVIGAELVFGPAGPPKISRVPTEWPVNRTMVLRYVSNGKSRLSYSNKAEVITCKISGDLLLPEWPQDSGIAGALKLTSTWTSGSTVEIQHTPTGLPFATIINQLDQTSEKDDLLTATGMFDSYVGSVTAEEKTAAILTALAIATGEELHV